MSPRIHLFVLASGSKGNAAVVEGPTGSVLVDCGISRKALHERANEAGCDLDRVQAILLTHEHADHTDGITVVMNHFDGPIYATAGTAAGRKFLSKVPFTLVDDDATLDLCGMRVQLFPTSHDVNDPVSFRFSVGADRTAGAANGGTGLSGAANGGVDSPDADPDDSDALGWVTDTGCLSDRALDLLYGCRILGIESNHDEHMLQTGPYPRYLKQRIASDTGHLSNAQAAEALRALVTSDTETVVGLHLSEKNNRPSVATRTLAEAVGAEPVNSTFTEARTPDGTLTVCVAAQNKPLVVF